MNSWRGLDSEIAEHVRVEAENTLAAYRAQPNFVAEHVAIEQAILKGGYSHRQIYELVQNAADAIMAGGARGRVHVLLTQAALYCANEGEPVDRDGATAILTSHMSRKRGSQIGHFGVGFKSVLAVTTGPQFFSRSGSFGFDPESTANQIRQCVPSAEATPLLRIAVPLDPAREAAADPVLADLMSWATTVVRLPRGELPSDWLSEDLKSFPSEFLLFSPHVAHLILEDQVGLLRREIALAVASGVTVVAEGESVSRWKVFQCSLPTKDLTPDARSEVDTKVIEREALPIIWAVPLDAASSRGAFWAFFPTEQETTLTGILNAPWKTSPDRQNLYDGVFNRALLDRAARLVAESLPTLVAPEDPGVVLDLLPARDTISWADRHLSGAIYPTLSKMPSVPGAEETLCLPASIRMRPHEALSDAAQRWLREEGEGQGGAGLCHLSVERKHRRARAKVLGAGEMEGVSEWVRRVGQPGSAEASLRAITLVGALWAGLTEHQRSQVLKTRFVLTSDGELAAPAVGRLFLPGQVEAGNGDAIFVHHTLAESDIARAILHRIGLLAMSPMAELQDMLKRLRDGGQTDWGRLWTLVRQVPEESALALLITPEVFGRLLVRTVSGAWCGLNRVLLPGPIVPDDASRDAEIAVDAQFHRYEMNLLRRLGLTDSPRPGYPVPNPWKETWFKDYVAEAKRTFCAVCALAGATSTPKMGSLKFRESQTYGPFDVLPLLSDEGKARFTEVLLPVVGVEGDWEMRHSKRKHYPPLPWKNPVNWMLRAHGRLRTNWGLTPVSQAVSPVLTPWDLFLPVARCHETEARALGLPVSLSDLDEETRRQAFLGPGGTDDDLAGRFYVTAARAGWVPDSLWCWVGRERVLRKPNQVGVAVSETEILALRAAERPFLVVPDPESASLLVARWGLKATEPIRLDFVSSDEEIQLLDRYPGLKPHLGDDGERLRLQPCSEVRVEILSAGGGISFQSMEVVRSDQLICYLDTFDPDTLLNRILNELDLDIQGGDLWRIKSYLEREERQRRIIELQALGDLPEKLLVAIGADAIRKRLPESVVSALAGEGGQLSPGDTAAAAFAVHGVEVLRRHAADLEAAGLDPPRQWCGSARALDFVQELGFPSEYAGFEGARRPPVEEVDGPIDLKPLHPFQEEIAARIQGFAGERTPLRGLLSLPTGAGKTRVVVEALTRCVHAGTLDGCIIWIAQSDELCEQAVQTWLDVWRSRGPRRRLRVSRLWGATNNRVVPVQGPLHLVVATFQTLVRRVNAVGYGWLRDASFVVVDEAHGSTTPSYTEILSSLGLTARETSRPLIGVTATPFRGGADEEETRRLVSRYGGHRFDHGVLHGDDPYSALQRMGILSWVDHQLLRGGRLDLSGEELEHLKQYQVLPPSAELRLGKDVHRNAALLRSIEELPSEWPVLVFTTSVEHAGLLAALLSLKGIPAKAISSETDMRARRYYIDEFKAGRIRVLTNYNVLTTGFDAPAVRALYIARPVYSRGLYQQMIGRGLRGPLNGGKERCLIINVEDNILEYGEQLAFKHFEHLWRTGS